MVLTVVRWCRDQASVCKGLLRCTWRQQECKPGRYKEGVLRGMVLMPVTEPDILRELPVAVDRYRCCMLMGANLVGRCSRFQVKKNNHLWNCWTLALYRLCLENTAGSPNLATISVVSDQHYSLYPSIAYQWCCQDSARCYYTSPNTQHQQTVPFPFYNWPYCAWLFTFPFS